MLLQVVKLFRSVVPAALIFAVFSNSSADAAQLLQLQIVEGEGLSYRIGTRATRGITVLVTDETGQPVSLAAVTFRLPDQGASGTFNSGSRTEVAASGADGRASVWGMRWNNTPGTVEIRISAAKEQLRAGIVSTQTLTNDGAAPGAGGQGSTSAGAQGSTNAGGQGTFKAAHHSGKWLWLFAAAAGAGAAGAFAMQHSQSASNPSTSPSVVGITIGAPNIVVGMPK